MNFPRGELPSYSHIQNALDDGPMLNSRKNIIAGPRPGDYFFHSPGLERPELREEGPFPLTGNIGSLLKQEGDNNYASCIDNISIGGGKNCTGVFNADIYTQTNTCGSNCVLQIPESAGIQRFGMDERDMYTNIHGLHAYENVRAAIPGKGPSQGVYGVYEFIPNLKKTSGNSAELNYTPYVGAQVGDFTVLPSWQAFSKYNYSSKD